MPSHTHDLLVIGAGAAGLTAAGGCAMWGLRVALIEGAVMGGECLNNGCVPSKALLASAARAAAARRGEALGVALRLPEVDFRAVHRHVHETIAAIAPEDSAERFETMGVEVLRSRARFLDARTLLVGNRRLSAPRLVIATGSRPVVPDVPGLADAPYLTNETLWELTELPRHLAILGAGPIGVEMAQAFRRLGSDVTLLARGRVLGRDDPDAAAVVVEQLEAEGVAIRRAGLREVARAGDGVSLLLDDDARLDASHLLIAAGRTPNIGELELDAIGVAHGPDGIVVDERRRTSLRHVFAVGDCRAGPRFTHAAGHDGSVAALNIALGYPARVDWRALPWVTYADPELAQVGLTEAAARERWSDVEVVREEFAHNNRAICEGDARGFLKLVRRRGRTVGATIVGARAGELLLPLAQQITGKASAFALGSAVVAYPTRAEIAKTAAFSLYERQVFEKWPRRWARLLARSRR